MTNRKDIILQKALELYLTLGYAGVSISVLQKELDMGRATLYYYFKDKDSLFREVIERYYVAPLRESLQLQDDISLSDMIKSREDLRKTKREQISSFINRGVTNSNLQSLILFAVVRFPEIGEEIGLLKKAEYRLWKQAAQNSIKIGEINKELDIDKVALMCSSIKEMGDFSVFINPNYGDRFMGSLQYLYKLLKK